MSQRSLQLPSTTSGASDVSDLPFRFNPGDRITGCAGLWHACDRMAAELATCQACDRPTFRVITITSAERLERRAPLCGRHYIAVTRYFPELRKIHSAPPQNL